jgi:arylsulfatase A-like enzyme
MADQLRADFLSCYGADFIDTPHIDSLADEGVLYPNSYSPSPVCVPARCVLLTGRDAIANGVLGNQHFLRPDLEQTGVQTWPQILSAAGYLTAAIGKMHFYPWDADFGFQHRVICEDKRWLDIEDDYYHHLSDKGLRKLHGRDHEGYQENRGAIICPYDLDDSWDGFVGAQAERFVREYDDDRPFAAMVGFPGPHCPYDPCAEYAALFDPADMPAPAPYVVAQDQRLRDANVRGNRAAWNGVDYETFTDAHKAKIRAHYAALVKQIDNQVGRILQALEETGRLDDTVIIFTSDHGDMLGDHGLIGKANFYQGSCRVPMLVRHPGHGCGSVDESLVSLEDVTATLLRFAGVQPPSWYDSIPLPGLGLQGGGRERVFGFLGNACMNFDGRYKWVKYAGGEQMLFRLDTDPQEVEDLADTDVGRQIARRLDGELTTRMMRSMQAAHSERLIAHEPLWDSPAFGQRGWQRSYPQSMPGD